MIPKTKVDAIILTYTCDEYYHNMTKDTIRTLRDSEPDIEFDIKIIETDEKDWDYEGCTVRHIKPFGYNKAINMGLELSTNDIVLVLNNDLIFHKGWLTAILEAMEEKQIDSASPRCPKYLVHDHYNDSTYIEGYITTHVFCGWCLAFKREALMAIYPLDEELTFLYQDSWVAHQLSKKGFKHALVGKSKVTHLLSRSLHLIPKERDDEMYSGAHKIFLRKIEAEMAKEEEDARKL